MDNGEERPVAFASHTLNPAEKKYSHLEKEGLAIIFAVKKFHHYIYERHFTIESDHKPLSFLFRELTSIISYSEMEFNTISVSLQYTLQIWENPKQCRCIK